MNRPARFTIANLRRAVKVAGEADLVVEIATNGTIRIVKPTEPLPKPKQPAVEPEDEIVL